MAKARAFATAALPDGDLALLCAQVDALPPLPAALSKLLELLNTDRASPPAVEAILRLDAALTARTLELANSAQFGLRREVASIAHATALLGNDRIRDLALCASLASRVPPQLAGYRMDARGAWHHNVGTAALTEELARRVAPECQGVAFTAGMLHDVGKLAIGVLLERHHSDIVAAIEERGLTLVVAERETLGIDHTEVGEVLLNRWGLPKEYPLTARWHHDPSGAPAEVRKLIGLVHVASSLAHAFGFGADVFGLTRSAQESERAALGLTRAVVEACVAEALPRVHALSSLVAA
ncbi:MAG: HDOD domain-containing protein [Myxococcales bacterium]|nr:HDOD domain-containing protein [Myxococcales bacterium]